MTTDIRLLSHQAEALEKLHSGSILYGGLGSGKSLTALFYFFEKELNGKVLPNGEMVLPKRFKNLVIITTARKRDDKEWDDECRKLNIDVGSNNWSGLIFDVVVDSWNNIHKYELCHPNTFFIFDEQRVVGSGSWVKSFLKITKRCRWILLTGTPGDVWTDYIPVFLANGFYRNRSEFLRMHAVYNRYSKYPKIDRWVNVARLEHLRDSILVVMDFDRKTKRHNIDILCTYDVDMMNTIVRKRWDPFENKPINNISSVCYLMRKVSNFDKTRFDKVVDILREHKRTIIFYNFDYERDILRKLSDYTIVAEWNGSKHEHIPDSDSWAYLVQYTAGSEGWNCTSTDTIIFYSQSYSYKQMIQASGRIDRLNTPFSDLYYYTLKTRSPIDISIDRALRTKRNFNERAFAESLKFARKT